MADDSDDTRKNDEDLRLDDLEFDPQASEPKSAKAWLNLLTESEDAFKDWNDHCDNIDELYANLTRLSNMARDRQYQMFWANMEVIKPSIYAKAPVPVVVTKFKDRRPVYQAASEVAERCAIVTFDLVGINELMKLIRDDLALIGRGVPWCRYESAGRGHAERVCIDFKSRKDFLHSLSRNWREVTWVAAASYLTRTQAKERFSKYSGDEYSKAEYRVDKDQQEVGGGDARERAAFWEIWDKTTERVVWVAQGCENILDEDDPHLELREFFPCPKPAYGTLQRNSLVPVPDAMQYQDQLQEINTLTGRIHALADAVVVRGFYPAGGQEIAEAVQAAVETNTPSRVLVPVSNWAAFGNTKEVIIWLPIDVIATTIQSLVLLRKQLIDDIYQITGLADIMRGDTDPQETLGAQTLKTQYGTSRIRDKQQELVRIARDLVEISLEIITEKFKPETIIDMSQTQLPTQAMVMQKAMQLQQDLVAQKQQIMQAQASPQVAQASAQNPDQTSQVADQAQSQIQETVNALEQLREQPTIEQVLRLFKDDRIKYFVLDIETDSTIQADEDADKQRRNEFLGVLSQLLPQLASMITAEPRTAKFCGEVLKFAVKPYRAGRELDGAVDELVNLMEQKGNQPQGDDPTTAQNKIALQIEQMKVQAQQQTDQGKLQLQAQEMQMKDRHKQQELANERWIAQMKNNADTSEAQADMAVQNEKMLESREAHQADMIKKTQDMKIQQQKSEIALATHMRQNSEAAERRAQQAMRPPPVRIR